ncbi:MAG: glycosyltransferase [Hadesarchaea archaeon]|nr:glycosyltransferase [Hadesarchaea archaeon]
MSVSLTDYRDFVDESKISEIYRKGSRISRRHILHISSTYYGGGVAEILRSLVPLLNDVGIDVGWRTVVGSPDFFRVTKKFHNALQGDKIALTKMKKKVYEETNEIFSKFTHVEHDLVVVHDPQPLPLIKFYKKKQPWIWRCHIDLSNPNEKLWDYLKSFVIPYDLVVYHTEEFAMRGFSENYRVIKPSIDPLSIKNIDLPGETVKKYLKKAGVVEGKPLISQVSRFDKWKDPIGVLKVFDLVRREMDCQLFLVGDIAIDDPEGQKMHERVLSEVKGRRDVRLILGAHDILVNAIQRASDVVLQKSIREGFGLSVSEALWKKTPVVASNVGGLPTQVIDGETGYLVDPMDYEAAAKKVMDLLSDPTLREKMGEKGREHVKKNFLITRHIEDWIDLWTEILEENGGD